MCTKIYLPSPPLLTLSKIQLFYHLLSRPQKRNFHKSEITITITTNIRGQYTERLWQRKLGEVMWFLFLCSFIGETVNKTNLAFLDKLSECTRDPGLRCQTNACGAWKNKHNGDDRVTPVGGDITLKITMSAHLWTVMIYENRNLILKIVENKIPEESPCLANHLISHPFHFWDGESKQPW